MSHKVLLVGPPGGRESALAWKLRRDGDQVFATNPNGGFKESEIARQDGKIVTQFDTDNIANFANEQKIDLVVVTGDDAIAAAVVDKLHRKGIKKVFGPTAAAGQLESSKAFAKDTMTEAQIPTAAYKVFTDHNQALAYVQKRFASKPDGLVIKASGLAQGKGVTIAHTIDEARQAIEDLMVKKIFKEAGETVVVEELLKGKELSAHALIDSRGRVSMFPLVADYKPAEDGDQGKNTGGMGVYGFLQKGTSGFLQKIKSQIVNPIIKKMREKGMPFVGLLYPGLMQNETTGDLNVLEYNARFGDPEAQVYMRLLDDKCKLFNMLDACIGGKLNQNTVKWKKGQYALSVTLAAPGYPGSYPKDAEIQGIEEAEKDPAIKVFHAGTKLENGKLLTNGGRVLHVTAVGHSLKEARDKAYAAVDKIKFDGKTYRKDIGLPGTREALAV